MLNEYDYIIIDPASPEFNRGSFCYLPYILYSQLKNEGYKVAIVEDFTCAMMDKLPKAENYLVAMWSYPQIDIGLVLNRFLPSRPQFFGYYPLIEKMNLLSYVITSSQIKDGIKTYVKFYKDFKFILLSDCDMHLAKYSGTVYPLFTSYGCSNGCKFCPVSVNCNSERIVLDLIDVWKVLDDCEWSGYKNIHFTDEDFFFDIDRAYQILNYCKGKGFNFIALGSVHTVSKFINKYGTEIFKESGMRLIEVGLESADNLLNKEMGKRGSDIYEELAIKTRGYVDIFWLTMTFYPGETLRSLRATGDFLSKYGFASEELYGRIQTNSTVGGLGQFFQYYDGTKNQDLEKQGIFLTERPVRLIPSFVPQSFLDCKIDNIRPLDGEDLKWFRLYNLPQGIEKDSILKTGVTVGYVFSMMSSIYPSEVVATYLALCGRLGIIS